MDILLTFVYGAAAPLLYFFASNLFYIFFKQVFLRAGFLLDGLWIQLLVELVGLALTCLYMKKTGFFQSQRQERERRRGRRIYLFPAYFCCIGAGLCFSVFGNQVLAWLRQNLEGFSAGYGHVEQLFYGKGLGLELLTLGLVGPLLEEFLYRGLMFRRLAEKWHPLPAAAATALLFGLVHGNLVQGLYALGMGLFFAYLYWRSKDLGLSIGAHISVNCLALLQTELLILPRVDTGKGMAAEIIVSLILAGFFMGNGNRMLGQADAVSYMKGVK